MNRYLTAILVITLFNSVYNDVANAQQLTNFVDLNQSRQFFEQGNQIIEQERKWLQPELKLPEIESTQKFDQAETTDASYSIEHQLKLKPVSNKIDNIDNLE